MIFKRDKDPICPFLKEPCLKEKCQMWMNIQGQMPAKMETASGSMEGGKIVDRWDCSITWIPVLLVEVAGKVRGMTAATESYRNETASFFTAFAQMVNKVSHDIRGLVALPSKTPEIGVDGDGAKRP